jgi:transcriptional regulator
MTQLKKVDLLQGTLELLILRMLQSGSANGWDLMQRMQLVSKDALRVTPGSLYPALHKLEARGLIASEWGASEKNRKAKFYKITTAGRRQLDAERQAWERFTGAIELILRDA